MGEARPDRASAAKKRQNFLDEEARVRVPTARTPAWNSRRRVLVDPRLAPVIDAGNDERRDTARRNQRLSGLGDMPRLSRDVRSLGIEKILAVVQNEQGIAVRCRLVVSGRQVDGHIAIDAEKPGMKRVAAEGH